jgi:phage/plasmid-like protein (TIGR03299 family)
MAHEITKRDDLMYVGQTPWHGLGHRLDAVATSAEAIAAANMDWRVIQTPVYTAIPRIRKAEGLFTVGGATYEHSVATVDMKNVEGQLAIVREDTDEVFAIMSDGYTPIQNTEAFEFFDALASSGEAIYHTVGSLKGGRRVWILAKLPGDLAVSDTDLLDKYILLANSHDGSRAFSMQMTPVRVVCNNTLSVALAGEETQFKAKHTSNIMRRVNDARDILGLSEAYFEMFMRGVERLVDARMTEGQMHDFSRRILGIEVGAKAEDIREPATSALATLPVLFQVGQGNSGENAWHAYNAVTEYVDHIRPIGRSMTTFQDRSVEVQDKRLDTAWFGIGAMLKQGAWDDLQEFARN